MHYPVPATPFRPAYRLERNRDIGAKSASILVGTVHALQASIEFHIICPSISSSNIYHVVLFDGFLELFDWTP